MTCIFCSVDSGRLIAKNDTAYAIRDGYPVTHGHTLIIPHRHAETFFDLTREEISGCLDLLNELRNDIVANDFTVTGFNIGMNAGASAGQTIFHCHIHLIPRRTGDVEDPRGGIRHVIPDKGYYTTDD